VAILVEGREEGQGEQEMAVSEARAGHRWEAGAGGATPMGGAGGGAAAAGRAGGGAVPLLTDGQIPGMMI
jgi:hypothetical protein